MISLADRLRAAAANRVLFIDDPDTRDLLLEAADDLTGPFTISIMSSRGDVLAEFNADQSELVVAAGLHLLIDQLIMPEARKAARIHGGGG